MRVNRCGGFSHFSVVALDLHEDPSLQKFSPDWRQEDFVGKKIFQTTEAVQTSGPCCADGPSPDHFATEEAERPAPRLVNGYRSEKYSYQ